MMHDSNSTIADFLEAAGAKQPTPGGGAIAALVGALGASMGEMVLNYSVGKKSLAEHEPALREAFEEFARARSLLLELMIEDQQAYEALTAARKLPDSAPDRGERFDVALLGCVRVPEVIGATALAVLQLAEQMLDKVNPYLLSDLAVCCELAMTTVRCAVYNIRANLPDVSDPHDRASIDQTAQKLLDHALPVIQRAIPAIWKRSQAR